MMQVVKNLSANSGDVKRRGFNSWVGKMPWRRAWQTTPVLLPGESPWTEEPGGLQSIASQRVGHDLSSCAHTVKEGFPGGTSGEGSTCQCRRCKRHRFNSWVGKIPCSRQWQSTPAFLPGKFHGQRSLVVHGVTKSRIRQSTVKVLFHSCSFQYFFL